MRKTEQHIAWAVAEYLTLKYPDVVYRFDIAADLYMTPGQANIIKNKLLHQRGFPDLTIFEPRGKYHGLMIEIKKDTAEVYKKSDGMIRQSRHIREQSEMLTRLTKKGYYATFGLGLNDCIQVIDRYLRAAE